MLWVTASGSALAADFVGTPVCRSCHTDAFEAWQGSHHDLAMQPATPESVLGDFDDVTVEHFGVETTFLRADGEYRIRTQGSDGKIADFSVPFVFGVAPLQQYLIALPDGRLQAFGIAWDSRLRAEGGQRWYHLYPDDAPAPDDPLHWSGTLQNWQFQCATCHSTDLARGYDPDRDRFDTTWVDIDVGCEACHGPGSEHVAWAGRPEGERGDYPAAALAPVAAPAAAWVMDPDSGSARPHPERAGSGQVDICADCHSRRSELAGAPEASPRFLDHFMPVFLTEGYYHPDGQIRDEVYVWGSFLQSRMSQAGVVCSDCHDPHGLGLKAPGDAVCAQCHLPAKFATPAHHHHQPEQAGARCVACHMPETTYMGVDPRRDHSLRVPRPDLSVRLGTPDACTACHDDQDAGWAAAHVKRWFPDASGGLQNWAAAFAQARAGDPRVGSTLVELAADPDVPDLARGTALLELQPHLTQATLPALIAGLADPSALVRIAALGTLQAVPPELRFELAGALLDDDLLAVRAEAGRVLSTVPRDNLSESDVARLDAAVAAYESTQTYNADRAEAQANLGVLYAGLGDLERAEAAYRRALVLDPGFAPGYANLADLLNRTGRDGEAAEVLAAGLQRLPESAPLHHAVGLQQVRAGAGAGAVAALQQAHELEPDNGRFAYVYAIAQNSTGDSSAALDTLSRTLRRHPYDRDVLAALASINRDAGNLDAARRYVERMLELRPGDPQAMQMLQQMQRRAPRPVPRQMPQQAPQPPAS